MSEFERSFAIKDELICSAGKLNQLMLNRPISTRYHIQIIQQVLRQRIGRNPQYSLRSFARDLKLDCGSLSRILNESQKISVSNAFKILNALGLNSDIKERFCLSICQEKTREIYQKFEISHLLD